MNQETTVRFAGSLTTRGVAVKFSASLTMLRLRVHIAEPPRTLVVALLSNVDGDTRALPENGARSAPTVKSDAS